MLERNMIEKPYLLFLGDVGDQLAAKTAGGIADWRPEWCVGQLRLPGCKADIGLREVTIDAAVAAGAKTLIIGVVNAGGVMPEHWTKVVVEAMHAGLDVASGLHLKLQQFPEIAAAAEQTGRQLHNIRHSEISFGTGKGTKRSGKRLLSVGTDCSVGKKYSALALEKEMRQRGMAADFRASGQTGLLIAERGVAIDAVIADFISGAAEWLSPDNEPDHWDIIEGQGSLFHAAYAGVTMGLLHGSQPDALVLCHEPTRMHMRGLPQAPLPSLEECLEVYVAHGRLTNPDCRFVGICINTQALEPEAAMAYLRNTEDRLGLPCCDPIAGGVANIVDTLIS
jgi:uncharacterized NAD-dependent epimerase/dehydratase family protein